MFEVTEDQQKKFKVWDEVCRKEILEKQKQEMTEEEYVLKTCNGEHPYFGAIGGNYTWSFTPNSIGMGVSVTNNYLKESLDLTDYDSW